VIDIQFGEGGKDSKMFVDDLTSAYIKYSLFCGLKVDILATSDGHKTISVKGKNAWMAFKNEPGKHVVQRIPPTESKGRRHTSTISVAVLRMNHIVSKPLQDKDIEIQTQRGSGPGGQHRNKTDSCVRAIHKPTGLKVCIDGRSQLYNKQEAIRILTAKVRDIEIERQKSKDSKSRTSQMGQGKRSGKVRTYNFIHGRVVDHILGLKTSKIDSIMKGRFDILFN
jgi:peptide chain release factor 1